MTTDDILALACAYAKATDRALSTVGRWALGNNRVFVRLAMGHGCNSGSIQRAALWFAEHWPEGAAWPEGVPRPAPRERRAESDKQAA
jgi:hypothetical protein